jgi:hypothetical protein
MSVKKVYSTDQIEMYSTRSDRRKKGLRITSTGPEFHFDDHAIMLWRAIKASDPEIDDPFSREDARKALLK